MHVISRKQIKAFGEEHPKSLKPLLRWFKIMQQSEFVNFHSLRNTFPSADKVNDLIVFNIGGNKYRLIASIHFNRKKVYIRTILTHQQYDDGVWKS